MSKNSKDMLSKPGFTLVELLVVIVIIATLAALALTVGPKMKRRSESVKIMQDMRQISTLSGLYTADSSGRIPPLQQEVQREDGGFDKTPWNLLLLSMAFPNVGSTKLREVAWWTSNHPFMLHPRILNDPKSGKFKADKSGYGMNKNLPYTYNSSNNDINWVDGKGGAQSVGVLVGNVRRPSRTPLYAPAPDFLYDGSHFTRADMKPLIVDGQLPIVFLDGHIESVKIALYTIDNYDAIMYGQK